MRLFYVIKFYKSYIIDSEEDDNMKRFYLKELLLIALTVAAVFGISYLLLPIMLMFPVFIYKPLLIAPIYSTLVYMLIYNLRKPGVLTLFSILLGSILFFFSPKMFLLPIVAGIITELVVIMLFRGYEKNKAVIIAASLFPAVHIPVALVVMAFIGGEVYKRLFEDFHYVLLFTGLSFAYGILIINMFSRLLNKKMADAYQK